MKSLNPAGLFLIFFLFCATQTLAQKISVSTVVVDSASGKPLPFATMTLRKSGKQFVGKRSGLVRMEKADGDEMVRISYIGFKTKEMKVSEIQKETRLATADNLLNEIVILPEADTIRLMIERANKAYIDFADRQQVYLYCQNTTVNGTPRNTFDARLVCSSAITLRDFRLRSARYEEFPDSAGSLAPFPNFVQLLSVSLVGEEPLFAAERPIQRPMLPLQDYGKQFYRLSYSLLSNGSDTILALRCEPKKDYDRQTFSGTLYFDHKTLALLKAEGELLNTHVVHSDGAAFLSLNFPRPRITAPLRIHFTINYAITEDYSSKRKLAVACPMIENATVTATYDHNGDTIEVTATVESEGKAKNHTSPPLRFAKDLREQVR